MTQIATKDLIVHNDVLGIDQRVLAGQPVPPELVEAYEKAGGNTDEPDAQTEQRIRGFGDGEQVIASEDLVVYDEALEIHRQVLAGQPVPPDLVEAYRDKVGDKKADESADDASESYDDQTVDELQALVDERGLEVEGTGADGNVLKKDLVAALEADDE